MTRKKSTSVLVDRVNAVRFVSLYLAFIFLVMALTQLFSFEAFPQTIAQLIEGQHNIVSHIIAAVIVVLEVFALPYLLAMKIPRYVRHASLLSAWFSLAIWFSLSLLEQLSAGTIANIGIFGASVVVPSGWWLVCYIAALMVLLLYVVTSGMKHSRHILR